MAEGSRALLPGRFRAEPAAPGQSVRVQIAITAVLAALSLTLGLSGTDSLLHDWAGHPLPLRLADVVFGSIAYVGLWWRRRYPLIFAGYVLAVSTFSTVADGLTLVAAYTVAVQRGWRTALITSALLAVSAWPELLLYNNDHTGIRVVLMLIVILTFAVTGWGMFVRARGQLLASLRDRERRAEEAASGGTDGVTATAQITAVPDPPRVIVLTTFDDDDLVHRAVGAGADGYLVKDTPPADIVSAIRSVAAGHGVLSPAVTRPLLELVQRAAAQPASPDNGDQADRRLSALTDREREVAIAIAHGTSNAEIGAQLYLSTATVKATVSRILTKLGLANRTQIAVVVRNSADPR
jgi:DNA-binding NarL/FixJ family response regulator